MDAALQRLLDIQAIKEIHLRYCRGIDRMDWDMVRSCYHADAIDDHGPFKGNVEGFIKWASELLAGFQSTTHFIGNQLVEVRGDTAWAECYCRAYHRKRATEDTPAMDWLLNVRYVDRIDKRHGEWRIARRVIVCESERFDPVVGVQDLRSIWHRGSRDRLDPSYEQPR